MGQIALQLSHQGIGQADTLALRHVQGDLVVEHVPVQLALMAVEQGIAAAGLPHAAQHHLDEQALELPGHRGQRCVRRLLRIPSQGGQIAEIGVGIGFKPVGRIEKCALHD